MRLLIGLLAMMSLVPVHAEVVFKDEGTSRIEVVEKDGYYETIRTETNYVFGNLYPEEVLYKVVKSEVITAGIEGVDGEVKVQAFGSKQKPYDTVLFSISGQGQEFSVLPEFIRITQYGCCGALDIHQLRHVLTGQLTEEVLGDFLLRVEVPNTRLDSRYLAIARDYDAPYKKGDKSLIGTVTYFTRDKVISRVRIYAKLPPGWGAELNDISPVVAEGDSLWQENSLTLWNSDGNANAAEAFNGFGLSASIYYESKHETLNLRVVNDQLSVDASTVSAELEIEAVP